MFGIAHLGRLGAIQFVGDAVTVYMLVYSAGGYRRSKRDKPVIGTVGVVAIFNYVTDFVNDLIIRLGPNRELLYSNVFGKG